MTRPARFPTVLLLLVALTAWPGAARAQNGKRTLYSGNPALAKVSSHLMRARALAAADRSAEEIAATVPGLRLRDGLPVVAIRLASLTPQLLTALRARGLEVDSHSYEYARAYGRLDPADLESIASLPEVITIRPMPRAGSRGDITSNQADVTMNSDDVRAVFGYDGTDVEVGLLSNSFNDSGGGTASGTGCARSVTGTSSQTSGDLPNGAGDVVLLDDCTAGSPFCDFLTDEGRALGELMFDITPSVTFSFHSAFNSPPDFAGGIGELRSCGADLIVDDVFWTGQAFFQDDVIAQAAQDAVDAGVPYFSAAGNDATFGVHDDFVDFNPGTDNSDFPPDGNDFHDFGSGDRFAEITIPDGCEIYAELQWAEPFASIGAGAGSASDLDLYLLNDTTLPLVVAAPPSGNVLDSSISLTGCGDAGPPSGDPIEFVSHTNTSGSPMSVFLAVEHFCGDETVPFRIVTLGFGPGCSTSDPGWDFEDGEAGESSIFVDAQIFGHPAARDVIAVAAAFFREIDTGGAIDPPSGQLDVEPYSSLGGDLPFYFDDNGSPVPMAPELRTKPEVTGPDGTNTSFFGSDIADSLEPPGDTAPNFFGTSAAVANSAAIAALILDATDLKINPLPLTQLLEQGAIDMEAVTGRDSLSGTGFTDALRPIRSLESTTTPLIDDLTFDLEGGDFFSSLPSAEQRLQANDTLTLGNGDFSGIDGRADTLIFTDGFESGNISAWSNPPPP